MPPQIYRGQLHLTFGVYIIITILHVPLGEAKVLRSFEPNLHLRCAYLSKASLDQHFATKACCTDPVPCFEMEAKKFVVSVCAPYACCCTLPSTQYKLHSTHTTRHTTYDTQKLQVASWGVGTPSSPPPSHLLLFPRLARSQCVHGAKLNCPRLAYND